MAKIFDAHCDTVYELCKNNEEISRNSLQLDTERMAEYDTYIQIFAAFIDKKNIKCTPMQECMRLCRKYRSELERNTGIKEILNLNDMKAAKCGGIYSLLSIEGAEALEGSLSNLRMYYDMGVRLITLTWNYANELADGIAEERGGGLTAFGVQAVSAMEDMGIMIDVSHLSEKAFWDVDFHARYPYMASHSCVKKLCSNRRNLTDEQINAIISKSGFIGINFFPEFLSDSGRCGTERIAEHIEYIVRLGGIDNVGFGSDFDGIGCLPDKMRGAEDIGKVCKCLKKCGMNDDDVEKISFGNLYRIFYDMFSRNMQKNI